MGTPCFKSKVSPRVRLMKKLEGLNIVFFESRHSKTLGDLIALQGGTAFAAPAMKEIPLENNTDVFSFAEKLFSGKWIKEK